MSVVLVVASHPDDEILGPGGTLAKHAVNGDEVHALIVSEGASSRYESGMDRHLRESAMRSAKEIGFDSIRFLGMPDQRLDGLPLIDVIQSIEPVVFELRPQVVYTHLPVDVNSDHGVVARALWTACRPYSTPWIEQILAFGTPSSTEWAWPIPNSGFQPNWYVDISTTLEHKLKAMCHYDSELRDYPHPRSLQALTERARYWGSQWGLEAAEPFFLMRGRS